MSSLQRTIARNIGRNQGRIFYKRSLKLDRIKRIKEMQARAEAKAAAISKLKTNDNVSKNASITKRISSMIRKRFAGKTDK